MNLDPHPPAELFADNLHASLSDPALSSMTFLNEIANKYPDAVNFAPGRPYEGFFDIEQIHRYLRRFERYLADERGLNPEEVRRTLFQYGRTKGVIHELVAKNLATDEGFTVDPDSIVVTVGCQEAMYLALRALRRDENDVLLVISPAYAGIVGAARLAEMRIVQVEGGDTGVDLDELTKAIRRARKDGLRPRACYLVPDFANPSGLTIDLDTRRGLVALAAAEGLLLLEDNPYRIFNGSAERLPTLKGLDPGGHVVQLGSYAKTGMPGARIGFAVADQPVVDRNGRRIGLLADELAKIKSMLTVNTSPIAQAVIAGRLLEHQHSLVNANHREIAHYRANLNHMVTALERCFGGSEDIDWRVPTGGFFLVMRVPFTATDAVLRRSAEEFGVLWTPMRHFYTGKAADHHIRLSFSSVDLGSIDVGVNRLSGLVGALS